MDKNGIKVRHPPANDASVTTSENPPKRPPPTGPPMSSANLAQRKKGPANLFITAKKPVQIDSPAAKKESVKQRLAREMVYSLRFVPNL
jgi:hypothetical protein